MTTTTASLRTWTGTLPLPLPDAHGRFTVGSSTALKPFRVRARRVPATRRARMLPSRDARGRFVSFPTTDAPSWYVFAADGYRIPGEVDVVPMQRTAPPAPQPPPPARVVRRRRSRMQPYEVATWIGMLLVLIGMFWYGVHLPVPHH